MNHRLVWGVLAALAVAALATPARAVDEEAIKRAVVRGVKALRGIQGPDGKWPGHVGATALAGLALLECGADSSDDAVQRAADVVRRATVLNLRHTYSISLSILFLDRLGDPEDVPLIESLMVRLLAGQNHKSGGWTYSCPEVSNSEMRRLDGIVKGRKKQARRSEESKPGTKRKIEDLAPEIQDQLRRLGRGQMIAEGGAGPGPGKPFPGLQPGGPDDIIIIGDVPGDNSNTQFAALAVWVGRRHGLPVVEALTRLNERFRSTQLEDGGWQYVHMEFPPGMGGNMGRPPGMAPGMPPGMPRLPGMGSTATMTCAGVLALAICDGATLELAHEKKQQEANLADKIKKDENLNKGLEALGAVIGDPKGLRAEQRGFFPNAPQPDRVGGRTYYFLWSLERLAMAMDLKTIGKKDWYSWGAEILLENQQPDGTWAGDYSEGGVDTAFALLFLRRANLARDLTAHLRGKITDPGERLLRPGIGLGKARVKKIKSGIESLEAKPLEKPAPKTTNAESAQLAEAVIKAQPTRRAELLETMESGKGPTYTEALATAIPKLDGEARSKAREALANRLTRMKDETLAGYLQDDDAEIRRAAAIAVGQKESKTLIPNLVGLLQDSETTVVRAAHASLKALTGKEFGPAPKATREERDKAVLKWIEWWGKQRKKAGKE